MTHAQVVGQARKITFTLSDDSKYQGKVISTDTESDLAVLKIDPPEGKELPSLSLGRSDDLMVGETVIAVGNPLGFENTLTTGVISAINRTLDFDGMKMSGLIQTDAPINRGNSGGPLLNVKGELIGINTAIRSDAQNIGFAIPVDCLAKELVRLLDFERLNRVVFGARVYQRHVTDKTEVVVSKVRPGTPAEGKVFKDDRIIAINDTPIKQIADYVCLMVVIKSDSVVRLNLLRRGKEISVDVRIKSRPQPDGNTLAGKLFGITLKPLNLQLARDLRLRVQEGLLIVGIQPDSPARKLGLEIKDVLFQVGRLYVTDLDKLGMALEDIKPAQKVRIGIVRGDYRVWATITAR